MMGRVYICDVCCKSFDSRFKNFKVESFAERRFRRWMSKLKIHKHCHCDEKTLRAIWNAMDEEDK